MTKQVKKKNICYWESHKIGLIVFKTQSMKTSLNSYVVLLKIFIFTENKAKLI